jgi:putative transposase
MAKAAFCEGRLSIRDACTAFTISETCYRYQAKLSDENAEIVTCLKLSTHRHRDWGFKWTCPGLPNQQQFACG